MTVTIKTYGVDANYWNAGPYTGPGAKDVLVRTNSNASMIDWSLTFLGVTYTGVMKGDFQFNGPISTLDQVSG